MQSPLNLNQIENIVQAASTAPSGDNCQPWSFVWNGNLLKIYHDGKKARHFLNFKNRASLLSLGTVLELIEIAASSFGMKCESSLNLKDQESSCWASVRFFPVDLGPDPLSDVISKRHTDRRRYLKRQIEPGLRKEVLQEEEHFSLAKSAFTDDVVGPLGKFISRSESCVWVNKAAHQDLMSLIRFREGPDMERDGMPAFTLGLTALEMALLRSCRSWNVQRTFNKLGFLPLSRRKTLKNIRSSSGLIVVTVRDFSEESCVEAGRLSIRIWLRLNQSGYAVQPCTVPSLLTYAAKGGMLPSIAPKYFQLFENGMDVFQKVFQLDSGEIPLWLLRTGLSTGNCPRSPRRPVSEILKVEMPTEKSGGYV